MRAAGLGDVQRGGQGLCPEAKHGDEREDSAGAPTDGLADDYGWPDTAACEGHDDAEDIHPQRLRGLTGATFASARGGCSALL